MPACRPCRRKGEGAGARLETGRLKLARGACPELEREAGLYRYEAAGGETPLDRDNHALAALRYLVMGLDAGRAGRLFGLTGCALLKMQVKSLLLLLA